MEYNIPNFAYPKSHNPTHTTKIAMGLTTIARACYGFIFYTTSEGTTRVTLLARPYISCLLYLTQNIVGKIIGTMSLDPKPIKQLH